MQSKGNFALIGSLLLAGNFFISSLFADGDPQLSISSDSGRFDAKKGEALYRASCQGCHMADGKGASGAGFYPSLAGNVRLMSAETTLKTVTNGLNGMPGFREYLTDDQIVEVVNYVRTSFGNNYKGAVRTADIPK
ncbi:MAG: cytochrome c [Helicobacteraceae bacterium]|nr:cytochrome c [Helicobacteraceae bacterium]